MICNKKGGKINTAYKEGTDALTGDDDTATNLWGSAWRMPTQAELQALLKNCDVAWTDNYKESGKKGRVYTGKGDYISNSIFLPAAGQYYQGNAYEQGDGGYYWSSAPVDNYYSSFLIIYSFLQSMNEGDRYYGYSVRAVLAE